MKLARHALVASALTLAFGVVYADEKGFNDMDKDRDGRLTRAEAAGNKTLLGKWKDADKNGDGVVTRAEYLAVMARQDFNTVKEKVTGKDSNKQTASRDRDSKEQRGFNDMDKNNDGKLTRAEAAGNKEVLGKWKEADKDGDGVLTRTEYLAVMARKDANTAKAKAQSAGREVKEETREAQRRTPKGEPSAATGTTTESGKPK
jgi:hypothetical protein